MNRLRRLFNVPRKFLAWPRWAALILVATGSITGVTLASKREPPPPGATSPSVSTANGIHVNEKEVLGAAEVPATWPLAVVRHRWQVKINQSNHVSIRPGSLYDIVTYFEQNAGLTQPQFNYLFLDLGLGTADPLYPVFQRGKQASWHQLLPAMWSEKNRHIDHSSVIDTPEGCRVHSTYWVRHIDEFPDRYHEERDAGYTLVDISFNHYERLRPDAECGRHTSHAPDPAFAPRDYIAAFADRFTSLADIPASMLAKYEAKVALLKLVSETFDRSAWPRFRDEYTFAKNSLWFYPNGVPKHYGLTTRHHQGVSDVHLAASDLVFDASETLRAALPLDEVVPTPELATLLAHIDGRPAPKFDTQAEPGRDSLTLKAVTPAHFYTSGLDVIPIGTADEVREHISNPKNYRLVSVLARPYQREPDPAWPGQRVVPQLRLIYQLVEPQGSQDTADRRPVEQLFLHVNVDATDRYAPLEVQAMQHQTLISRLGDISESKRSTASTRTDLATNGPRSSRWEDTLVSLLRSRYEPGREPAARVQGVQTLSYSSSLTGIWVFGTLAKSAASEHRLTAQRVVRQGIDVGYYSSYYDMVLFRDAARAASGERRRALEAVLERLTPRSYRDPRRSDPKTLKFAELTCAQCHQMAARDAVHLALNDELDSRYGAATRPTEFVMRELDRQLASGQTYWSNPKHDDNASSRRQH